ncbi:signal recognition particle-docking protein FtsY [Blattabacterium cuenoti]|uniref:signal recognition particle-docking protein FtsY n=1 Tax=Blattabacterium cuenoti TaxID=1653831 RepID=UPI00163CA366|nr:signal recognition particle-docking protein FtsY [Blattabacterium cuenoti]
MLFFNKKSLEKTKLNFFSKIQTLFSKKQDNLDNLLDKLENILLSADFGTKTTIKIINNIEQTIKNNNLNIDKIEYLYSILKEEINKIFIKKKYDIIPIYQKIKMSNNPYVIMMIGVNGVGKTTTIGKLAFILKQQGLKLIIGAADTFRAAAINQLEIWTKQIGIPIIKKKNSDPASVAYDTLQSAISKKMDAVLIDTAGRLQNRIGLMEELSKINRVMKKVIPNAPHEIMLILDANIGQNTFEQVRSFSSFVKISSIIITKLEGTAKGGVLIGIIDQFNIPIQYIGIGEKINDLKEFNQKEFIDSFFYIKS